MSKIEISKVAEICKKNQVPPEQLRAIVEEMNLAVQPEGGEEDAPPAVKKQFVLIISDPEGRLPKEDFAGWAVQIPESESPLTAVNRIKNAALNFNDTKKGRLLPVATIGEAIENVPAKLLKEHDVWAKTRTPVLVVRTDNQLPKS